MPRPDRRLLITGASGYLGGALVELASGSHAGVLNVAGTQAVSRHRLGVLVALANGLDPEPLRAGSSAERGLTVPGEVRLCVARAQKVLRTRLRGVEEFLAPEANHPGPRITSPD